MSDSSLYLSQRQFTHNSNNLEEENLLLRKQLRLLEAESRKNQAVFEQKIEILQNQITDAKKREQSLNKMNETVMAALNDLNNDGRDPRMAKMIQELETATEQHHKEMQEYKIKTNDHIKFLEKENRDLREKLSDTEMLYKELKLKFERGNFETMQNFKELQNERINLEALVKKYEDEKKQNKDLCDYEISLKMNGLREVNEKLKEDHRRELAELNARYDKSLKDIKLIFESERKLLESKLEKMSNLLKRREEVGDDREAISELKNLHQIELEQIEKSVEQMKQRHLEEVESIIKQRDAAIERAEAMNRDFKRLKVQLKSNDWVQEQNLKASKDNMDRARNLIEPSDDLVHENIRQKEKISALNSQIEMLEASQNYLKDLIVSKETRTDAIRINLNKSSGAHLDTLPHDSHPGSQTQLTKRPIHQENPLSGQYDTKYLSENSPTKRYQQENTYQQKNSNAIANQDAEKLKKATDAIDIANEFEYSAMQPLGLPEMQNETTQQNPLKITHQNKWKKIENNRQASYTNGDQLYERSAQCENQQTKSQGRQEDGRFDQQDERIVEDHFDFDFRGSDKEQLRLNYKSEILNSKAVKENQYEVPHDFLSGEIDYNINEYERHPPFAQKESSAFKKSNYKEKDKATIFKSDIPRMHIQGPKGYDSLKNYDTSETGIGYDDHYPRYASPQARSSQEAQALQHMQSSSNGKQLRSSLPVESSMRYVPDISSNPRERVKANETNFQNIDLPNRRNKGELQEEFENLTQKLKNAEFEASAFGEDQTFDKEMARKGEIKCLISKLLRVKNELSKQHDRVSFSQELNRLSSFDHSGYFQPEQYHQDIGFQGFDTDQYIKLNDGSLGEALEQYSKANHTRSNSSLVQQKMKQNLLQSSGNKSKSSLKGRSQDRNSVTEKKSKNTNLKKSNSLLVRKNF